MDKPNGYHIKLIWYKFGYEVNNNTIMKLILTLILGLILLGTVELNAQNDLTVSYDTDGLPDVLNICGYPDTATVLVSTTSSSILPRANLRNFRCTPLTAGTGTSS